MRRTFFRHFCAGEDAESIKPVIHELERNGIGAILDYAAEADLEEGAAEEPSGHSGEDGVVARVCACPPPTPNPAGCPQAQPPLDPISAQ